MANKKSFTEEEWKDLQWAVMLAGSYVTGSDYPGFWNSFKEAAGGSRFLTGMQASENELVADLSKDQARKRPPDISDRAGLASDTALGRIRNAAALIAERAPEDLADFRFLLVGLAKAVAQEVEGTSEKEAEAVERVRQAAFGE
jgi:hypothetical protein